MTDHDRLDLSELDPMRDAEQWERVMAATLVRVDAVLSRRTEDPLAAIAAWSRPLLVAAAAALVLLIPVEFALELREQRAEQVQRLVSLSTGWDDGEEPPTGAEFLRALTAEETQ
jgi:hypothetical protein